MTQENDDKEIYPGFTFMLKEDSEEYSGVGRILSIFVDDQGNPKNDKSLVCLRAAEKLRNIRISARASRIPTMSEENQIKLTERE